MGWFTGTVVEIIPNAESGYDRRCVYTEDGDVEDLRIEDLVQLAKLDKKSQNDCSVKGRQSPPTINHKASSSAKKKQCKIFLTFFGGRSGQGQLDPFADPSLAFAASSVENDCEEEEEDELSTPVGEMPSVYVGDVVRVVSSRPIIHDNIPGHDAGVCSVGLIGTVTRVLDRRSYPNPMNVAVMFEWKM